MNGRKIFTLLEVTRSIQNTIADRYKSPYWIKAEMSKLNFYRQSGHCYPELVEKSDGKIIAQVKCNLWRDDFIKINSTFQRILKEPLKDGIKILFLATIGFHPEYGLTLRIIDIDPHFTLGDLEREKQETISKLSEEGIFSRNKDQFLPLLPQRVAIISVQSSKGYADFLKVFESANIEWGYQFFHLLFPALLQGDKAIPSIIHQLKRIRKVRNHFDVVAIVRGGGGDVGLSCFNNHRLAREIALFPLPVVTGIGHATNETVVEMIAFENAITPTKLAEFLIQKLHDFSVPVQEAEGKIIDRSLRLLSNEKTKFHTEVKLFRSVTRNVMIKNKNSIKEKSQSIFHQSVFLLRNEKESLDALSKEVKKEANVLVKSKRGELNNIETNLRIMSPENVLKRGYSITLLNGKVVRNHTDVKEGDILNTQVYEGTINSVVRSTHNSLEQGWKI